MKRFQPRFSAKPIALVTTTVMSALLFLASASLVAQDSRPASMPADNDQKTTESGLKYSILKEGRGSEPPKMGDKVKVHYTGWLMDGTEFDSSRKRGKPSEFVLGQVIKGWNEGLKLMTAGARYKFTIPSALAYGEAGKAPAIPMNADLIFDVELISFDRPTVQFTKAKLETQKTTESGLKYEVLVQGKGELLAKDVGFQIGYALWNQNGELWDCTEHFDITYLGKTSTMNMPFLEEAPLLMREGAILRFEVPKGLGDTRHTSMMVWQLEMLRIYNPPKFSMSPADKIKKTASGLKYEILKEGKGKSPTNANRARVHYSGWLTDGTSFDSSYESGQPATFGVTQVIAGWTEGLKLMKEGAIYKFTIPGNLAYGPHGSGAKIGPNATLVFVVELIQIR